MKVITMDVHMKRTNVLYTVANTTHPKRSRIPYLDNYLELKLLKYLLLCLKQN